jgi:oligoendopeptidase F
MSLKTTTYLQSRWSLADLFPSVEGSEFQNALGELEKLVAAFEAIRPQLKEDLPVETFLGFLRQMESIAMAESRLYGFVELMFSENTQNQAALSNLQKVDQAMAELGNRVLFFSLWWKELPDAAAERLMAGAGDFRYFLEEMRHFKPHTLSEAEEKIINLKNVTGANALNTLYETITNGYVFHLTVNGEAKDLTRGELMSYVRQHNPELRAQAYQELYKVYGEDGPVLGQIYQTLVRDWRNEQISLRKFEKPMSVRNLINDIPDPVVDTLLDVAARNVGIFQRFFQLKARWLGMERLRRYDIYAPVVKSEQTYPFEEAASMVLESFAGFDPHLAELAERVFAQGHLDSQVRKGKRGGAFCATPLHNVTPWVLVNYQGKADDVATLAHELGHAIHSMLAAHHTQFTAHACLPLAETASTFGEMMLVEQLLAAGDENVKRDLLFRQVDDSYATIQRQAFFALYERQAHEMTMSGASPDELAAAYLENLKIQFGQAVDVADEFRWEWVSIPHIYGVPFYVYAYSFGQLLVLSLYQQYKVEGEAFKPRYLNILSTGGSKAPVQVLADAGIDVSQPAFWQGGFDVIGNLVSQLEALPIQK